MPATRKQWWRLLGLEAIVGVTCKASRHLAIDAAEAGADYVAFGAFFGSTTRKRRFKRPDILAWWSETTSVICVAIGGITAANCGPLVAAGADFGRYLRRLGSSGRSRRRYGGL